MMKIFFEFLRIDFALLLRGRIGMFWTLAFPALMLILQMTLFGGGNALGPIDFYLVDLDQSPASRAYGDYLSQSLAQQTSVKIKLIKSKTEVKNDVDVMLTIPAGFANHAGKGVTSRITWGGTLKDDIVFTATKGIVSGITDAYNIEASAKPRLVSLAFPIVPDTQPRNNYPLYLVTGLCGMIILSTSLMGFAPVLVAAREAGMFQVYQLFPIQRGLILVVFWVSRLLMSLSASLVMFVAAWLLYGLTIDGGFFDMLAALALLALGTGAFLSIGILIASFSNNLTTATMIANFLYFPLLFSGNVIVPVSSLPRAVRDMLDLLPLNTLVGSMRGLLTGHADSAKIGYTVLILCIVTALALVFSFKKFTWQPRS